MIEHPELKRFQREGGLFDVEPCEMDLNIGRRGQLVEPDTHSCGMESLLPFVVIGVQKNYRGVKCYRVAHDNDLQRVGKPYDPMKVAIEWLG